jgi:3-deoxy-D-manno-octulosonic-acid transferase
VRSLLERWRPEAFLFTETEVWPTCLDELAAAGVPCFMVSGRVSARTAARGRWLRPLFRSALSEVVCCMQSPDDAARVVALGADPARVHVTGSLKLDGTAAAMSPELARVADTLELGRRRLLIAGSTHEGEEAAVLDAFARVRSVHPDVLLLLAPRHPERFAAAAALVERRGHRLVRWGALVAGHTERIASGAVVLLDALGPLAAAYGLGAVAFVGGSLVPSGGHNVLEPARLGRPVLVGPHTASVGEILDHLLAADGALRVADADELAAAWIDLVADPQRAGAMGARARAVAERAAGAVARHVALIAAALGNGAAPHGRGLDARGV